MTFCEKHAERVLCKFTGDGILNYVPFFLQCHKWVAIASPSQPIKLILQDWVVVAAAAAAAVCFVVILVFLFRFFSFCCWWWWWCLFVCYRCFCFVVVVVVVVVVVCSCFLTLSIHKP